jgi:hypothetical protein
MRRVGATFGALLKGYPLDLAAPRAADDATHNKAFKGRDLAATMMTSAQIAEAQRMAREWKPTK